MHKHLDLVNPTRRNWIKIQKSVTKGIQFRAPKVVKITRVEGLPRRRSGTTLAVPAHLIFKCRQLFGADGAARVKSSGGDANLRAKAELPAIRELGRCVPKDDRAVGSAKEIFGGSAVLGDDCFGVTRSEAANVIDRSVDILDCSYRKHGGEIFSTPICIGSLFHRNDCPGRLVAAKLASFERRGNSWEEGRGCIAVNKQGFGGPADRYPSKLRVGDDRCGHFRVCRTGNVGVTNSF